MFLQFAVTYFNHIHTQPAPKIWPPAIDYATVRDMRAKYLFSILLSAALIYEADVHFFAVSQATETQDTETIDLPFKDVPFAAFVRQRTLWLVAGNDAHLAVE